MLMKSRRIIKVKPQFNGENERIYCICRGIDDGSLMLQCDHCKEWYHAICVGLIKPSKKAEGDDENSEEKDGIEEEEEEEEDVDLPDTFACESCKEILGSDFDQESGTSPQPIKRKVKEITTVASKKVKQQDSSHQKHDKIRSMARKGFLETFTHIFDNVESLKDTALSCTSASDQMHVELDPQIDLNDPESFSLRLEGHFYDLYGSDNEKYKSKFRSLQFNLKDPSNTRLKRRVLFMGPQHVTLEELVALSPEEMANDHVFNESEKVARESLKSVFKPKGDIAALIDKIASSAVPVDQEQPLVSTSASSISVTTTIDDVQRPAISSLLAQPPSGPSSPSAAAEQSGSGSSDMAGAPEFNKSSDSSSFATGQLVSASQGHAKRRQSLVTAILPHTMSTATASLTSANSSSGTVAPESVVFTKPRAIVAPPQAPNQVDSLEDLLAKMDSTSYSASVLENPDLGYVDAGARSGENASGSGFQDNEIEDTAVPSEEEFVWQGSVKMPLEGQFAGRAIQVYGPPVPQSVWPSLSKSEFIISGRISSIASTKYLYERMSKKNDIVVVEFFPDSTASAASSSGFQKLVSYFSTKDRWAVVDKPSSVVKDLYLVPIPAGHQIIPFFSDLEAFKQIAAETKRDRFFGIYVLAIGALAPRPSVSSSKRTTANIYTDPRLGGGTKEATPSYIPQSLSSLLPGPPPPTLDLANFMSAANTNVNNNQFPQMHVQMPMNNQFLMNQFQQPMQMPPQQQAANLASALLGFGNVNGVNMNPNALNDLLKNLNQATRR